INGYQGHGNAGLVEEGTRRRGFAVGAPICGSPFWALPLYTMRVKVKALGGNSYRFTTQVLGPGLDEDHGWVNEETLSLSEGAFPCGYVGLAMSHFRS